MSESSTIAIVGREQLDTVIRDTESAARELIESEKRNATLQRDLAQTRAEAKVNGDEAADLRRELGEAQVRIGGLTAEAAEWKAASERDMAKSIELGEQLDAAKETIITMTSTAAATHVREMHNASVFADIVKERDQLKHELDDLRIDRTQFDQDAKEAQSRAISLQSELDAAKAEIDRLTGELEKANSQAEHFEREWYLRGDRIEHLESCEQSMRAALENIAHNHPSPSQAEEWIIWAMTVATDAITGQPAPKPIECDLCDNGEPCTNQYGICSRHGGQPHGELPAPKSGGTV